MRYYFIYLERKIYVFIDLKNNEYPKHSTVIGIRLVGKTKSILNFVKVNYDNAIYVNFALEKKHSNILTNEYNVNSVIAKITLTNPLFFKKPNTRYMKYDLHNSLVDSET